jgi:hypothetical protein
VTGYIGSEWVDIGAISLHGPSFFNFLAALALIWGYLADLFGGALISGFEGWIGV